MQYELKPMDVALVANLKAKNREIQLLEWREKLLSAMQCAEDAGFTKTQEALFEALCLLESLEKPVLN